MTIPRLEVDAVLIGQTLYLSAQDIIDHLEATERTTEPLNDAATAVLRAYRRTLADAVKRQKT